MRKKREAEFLPRLSAVRSYMKVCVHHHLPQQSQSRQTQPAPTRFIIPAHVRSAELVVHMPFVRIINMTRAGEQRFILRSLIYKNKWFASCDPREELKEQENILEETSARKATFLTAGGKRKKESERRKGEICVTTSELFWVILQFFTCL